MRKASGEHDGAVEMLDARYSTLLQGIGAADRLAVGRALLAIAAVWHLHPTRGGAHGSDPWATLRNHAAHGPRTAWIDEQILAIGRSVEDAFPQLHGVFTAALLTGMASLGGLVSAWLMTLADAARVGGLPSRAAFAQWFDGAVQRLVADGRDAAHVGTPPEVARLMVALGDLRPGDVILDPCCGVANTLAAALDYAEREGFQVRCVGQEINVPNAALAHLRLFLRGSSAEVRTGDALQGIGGTQETQGRQFDRVLLDPPIGTRVSAAELGHLAASGGLPLGVVGRTSADGLWLQLALSALGEGGRAVAFVPIGFLFRSGGDARLREYLLERDLVHAVVSLPAGVLPWTGVQTAVVVLSKRKLVWQRGRVLLAAVGKATERRRGRTPLTNADIHEVVDVFRANGPATESPARVAWEMADVQSLLAVGSVLDPRRLLAPTTETAVDAPADRLDHARDLEHEAASLASAMDELLNVWWREQQGVGAASPLRASSPSTEDQ